MKKLLLLSLLLAFFIGSAAAELAVITPPPVRQIRTEDGSFPALNADGLLDEGEFIFKDVDNGIWRYCSTTLRVEIIRYKTTDPRLTWYEAEIIAAPGEAFHMKSYSETKPMSKVSTPAKVAKVNQCVFATSTDYAHTRLFGKSSYPGVVIRNGVIYADKTRPITSKFFPNLDVLALYPDGNMEVYRSTVHTAQEYLDMGVESTLAFGPVLIKDGEINELALTTYNQAKNPRLAVGMVEKGHYWCIMVEGRSNVSSGISLAGLTQMMTDKGCTQAFNLDGGGTACMVFMGNQITRVGNARASEVAARSTADVLAIGTSDMVPYNGD